MSELEKLKEEHEDVSHKEFYNAQQMYYLFDEVEKLAGELKGMAGSLTFERRQKDFLIMDALISLMNERLSKIYGLYNDTKEKFKIETQIDEKIKKLEGEGKKLKEVKKSDK